MSSIEQAGKSGNQGEIRYLTPLDIVPAVLATVEGTKSAISI